MCECSNDKNTREMIIERGSGECQRQLIKYYIICQLEVKKRLWPVFRFCYSLPILPPCVSTMLLEINHCMPFFSISLLVPISSQRCLQRQRYCLLLSTIQVITHSTRLLFVVICRKS